MRHIIRLSTLEIENIKNVQYGKIEFARSKKGSILGIYGQNGSGKTVVVDCMVMLKCLLSGRRMPARFYHYINALAETAGYTGALKAPVRCFGNHLSEKRKSLFQTDNKCGGAAILKNRTSRMGTPVGC